MIAHLIGSSLSERDVTAARVGRKSLLLVAIGASPFAWTGVHKECRRIMRECRQTFEFCSDLKDLLICLLLVLPHAPTLQRGQ